MECQMGFDHCGDGMGWWIGLGCFSVATGNDVTTWNPNDLYFWRVFTPQNKAQTSIKTRGPIWVPGTYNLDVWMVRIVMTQSWAVGFFPRPPWWIDEQRVASRWASLAGFPQKVHPQKLTAGTWKWWFPIGISFSKGPFSGSMFVLGGVSGGSYIHIIPFNHSVDRFTWKSRCLVRITQQQSHRINSRGLSYRTCSFSAWTITNNVWMEDDCPFIVELQVSAVQTLVWVLNPTTLGFCRHPPLLEYVSTNKFLAWIEVIYVSGSYKLQLTIFYLRDNIFYPCLGGSSI